MITFKLETDPSLLEGKSRNALSAYKHDCVIANVLTTRKHTVTLVTPSSMDVVELGQDAVIESKLVVAVAAMHDCYISTH